MTPEAAADVITEHARQQRIRGKVAEELRMLPGGDAGQDDAIEIADDRVEVIPGDCGGEAGNCALISPG